MALPVHDQVAKLLAEALGRARDAGFKLAPIIDGSTGELVQLALNLDGRVISYAELIDGEWTGVRCT